MNEFPHHPPKGYSYEFEQFKRHVTAIWICNHSSFDYNGGIPVRSIWGFYNQKTRTYHSPVNSKTVGCSVNIEQTSNYSAMIPNLNALMSAFV